MAFLGVTPPISTASPTPKEEHSNNELLTFLTLHRVAESDEGNRKRTLAVELLLDVFKQWVTEVGIKRGVSEADCEAGAGARLFVFGSQRLGVNSPDADIDILCCAPQFVTRYDFFLSFLDKLQSMDSIINVLSLPDAYTPVIKFSLNNLSIDLVFVSLAMPKIPEDIDILDNCNLKKLDEASIRSLNGVRVTEMILKLVPNKDAFCVALRAIKCWATRRGIYSNVLGFLGGVNFAILVAFVCQRYTQACPSTIIHQFFKIFSQWHWPAPIILTSVTEVDNVDQTDMPRMPSWNPKLYPSDGYHLMPIITPAFPSMNSAFNVSIPQFRMIQLEIQRGLFLFEAMENVPSANSSGSSGTMTISADDEQPHGGQPSASRTPNSVSFLPQSFLWNTLFASAATDFFQLCPRYIQIDVTAQTAEGHRLWFGWCESRLRQLYVSIEQSQMVYCHPNANCFHRRVSISPSSLQQVEEKFIFSSSFFVGLSFPERTQSLDLTEVIQAFKYRVCSWVGKTAQMDLFLRPLQSGDLPDFVFSEISLPSNANSTGCTPGKPARQVEDRSRVSPASSGCEGRLSQVPATPEGVNEKQSVKVTVPARETSQPRPGNNSNSAKQANKECIIHSGSTPKLALLALNSNAKENQKVDDGAKTPQDSKSSEDMVRIEKQLFADDNNNTCGNKDSYGKGTATPLLESPQLLPPGQTRSPSKTTRKEFAELTDKNKVIPVVGTGTGTRHCHHQHPDGMLSTSQVALGGEGRDQHDTSILTPPPSPEEEESEDFEGIFPCFSSPLKRVRPN